MSPTRQNNLPVLILITLNLFWSGAATIYDRTAIQAVPAWALMFTVVCPLYPLLLALVWYRLLHNLRPLPLLTSFAALPAATYAVLSLVFYPLIMRHEGFSLIDCGQILWVLFYGLQGWYALNRFTPSKIPLLTSGLFMLTSIIVQYRTLSFGYLGIDILTIPERQAVSLIGFLTVAAILAWLRLRVPFRRSPAAPVKQPATASR